MAQLNFNNTCFIKSAAQNNQFITDYLPEVVFAGKSNVGKSSVINRILNRKNFARVGNTPGKTVHVNYFKIDDKLYFVDLPGYGFANVSKSERDRWSALMESFFSDPARISLGVLIVDARHNPTADDIRMCSWFKQSGCRFVVLANKLDKLKKSETEPNMQAICSALCIDSSILIPFSAEKGTGRELLLAQINKLC